MQKAIEISDLSFRYADVETDTLRIDSWHCGEGERVFLSGASGSGKSSLIKLLAGLLSPQSGAIKILGTTVSELSQAKRDAFRAANIGIVFQQFNLIPFLSALENLHLAQSFSAQNDASKQDFAKSLLNAVNIKGDQVGKPTGNLSVGQQQRVAIARALVNKPKIILADEPTSSLDAGNTDIFLELLFSLADNFGSTLLFVSHDAQLQARFGSVQSIENLTLADHVTETVADQDKDKSKALEMYR